MPVVYFNPFVFPSMAWAAGAAGSHWTEIVVIALAVTAAASAGVATAMAARRRTGRSGQGPRP